LVKHQFPLESDKIAENNDMVLFKSSLYLGFVDIPATFGHFPAKSLRSHEFPSAGQQVASELFWRQ